MKLFCRQCGVHFPGDFVDTLHPICNFWGDRGLGNLPLKLKEKLWVWLTAMPADEIFGKTGVNIAFSFSGEPSNPNDTFEKQIAGWNKMSEKQRQTYQKFYFKSISMNRKPLHHEIMDKVSKVKEELSN